MKATSGRRVEANSRAPGAPWKRFNSSTTAGTKIKVLESLFFGRVPITTMHSHQGFEQLADGESLVVTHNEDELASRCIELLGDPVGRARLADHGRGLVVTRYSFDHFSSVVRETVERFIGTATP